MPSSHADTLTMSSPHDLDQAIQTEFGQLPALSAPPGVISNFNHPYSRGYLAIVVTALILPITTIFVLLRTYTKFLINKHGSGKEDYACLLAFAGFVVYNGLCLRELQFGNGIHQWNVPIVKAMHFAQGANYLEIVYTPTIFFTKLALLLSLLKIFAPVRTGANYWLCLFTIWFNLLFYTAVVLVAIFACWPREAIWDPLVPGKCVNPTVVLIITSAINMLTDLVVLILPIVSVWKLKMGQQKKVGISAIFATGSFAVICSIMRVVSSVQLVGKDDLTYLFVDQGLWANGELGSGIIAGCMLSIPQFFRNFTPRMTSWIGGSKKSSGVALSGAASGKNLPSLSDPGSSFSPTDTSTISRDYIESEERAQLEERVRRYTNESRAVPVKAM